MYHFHCRFKKCAKSVLKKDKKRHEEMQCEHREVQCEKDCELIILAKELDTHNCLLALKSRVAGKISVDLL